MKRSAFFLLFLCVLSWSCKDDEVASRTIFKFNAQYFDASTADTWVVLRDHVSGDVIDSRQVTVDNISFTFESTKRIGDDKMDVTVFQGTAEGPVTGQVYTGVPVGSDWVWSLSMPYSYPDRGEWLGKYTLNVTGITSLFAANVSDIFGRLDIDAGGPRYTYNGLTLSVSLDIRSKASKHLVTVDTGTGVPMYLMIDGFAPNQTITVDYSAFKNFDDYIEVTFPRTNSLRASVVGYEANSPINDESYTIQEYDNSFNGILRNEIKIGLLNSLTKYGIKLHLGNFNYVSYGPAPKVIPFVDAGAYTTFGTTIADYAITSSASFTYRRASFGYLGDGNRDINFRYYASSDFSGKHYNPITDDLASKYSIDFSKIKYRGTMFNVIGRSYEDLLKFSFDATFDQFTPYQEGQILKGL